MRTVEDVFKRWDRGLYVMSLYLTKDALYDDLRQDFGTVIEYAEKLEEAIDKLDLWDRIEEVMDEH